MRFNVESFKSDQYCVDLDDLDNRLRYSSIRAVLTELESRYRNLNQLGRVLTYNGDIQYFRQLQGRQMQ